jgi:hypothetical protein
MPTLLRHRADLIAASCQLHCGIMPISLRHPTMMLTSLRPGAPTSLRPGAPTSLRPGAANFTAASCRPHCGIMPTSLRQRTMMPTSLRLGAANFTVASCRLHCGIMRLHCGIAPCRLSLQHHADFAAASWCRLCSRIMPTSLRPGAADLIAASCRLNWRQIQQCHHRFH